MNPGRVNYALIRTVNSNGKPASATLPASRRLRTVLPILAELFRPRRGVLALGLLLMIINRVSGLVLPYSTKYLIDTVIVKRHFELLKPLVLLVLAATAIQGVTSFALTQLLSKAAQRLITELRRKVQAHVGRGVGEGREDSGDDPPVVGIGPEVAGRVADHDQVDHIGAPGGQRAGGWIGAVAEVVDDAPDALPDVEGDPRSPVDDP